MSEHSIAEEAQLTEEIQLSAVAGRCIGHLCAAVFAEVSFNLNGNLNGVSSIANTPVKRT